MDGDGGDFRGAVWILSLASDGMVESEQQPFLDAPSTFSIDIPNDPTLICLEAHAPGLCARSAVHRPHSALFLRGLSNALDLVVGR